MRLFQRALGRANLPVRYSAGFNPRPRIHIVLPRPVGVASQDELLLVDLERDVEPTEVLASLSPHAPAGLRLISIDRLAPTEKRRPYKAVYGLRLAPHLRESVDAAARAMLAGGSVFVRRTHGESGKSRPIDIRPFLVDITITDQALSWTQFVTQDGTARIGEVLDAVGLTAADHLHYVVRLKVEYLP